MNPYSLKKWDKNLKNGHARRFTFCEVVQADAGCHYG
jgi:hypothetical protein